MRFSFESSEQELYEFERLLSQYGIRIEPDSDLERISLSVIEMNEKYKGAIVHDNNIDIRRYISEAAGLSEFIRKILKHRDHPDFEQLIAHLQLLNHASVPQTVVSPVSDAGSNKLFELYIALLCMSFADEVKLDSPNAAKGDNPDVMFTYQGFRWAIACKTMHSKSEKTLFNRVQEGVAQINRSPADRGVVAINFKNIINYDELWPMLLAENTNSQDGLPSFGCYPDIKIPIATLFEYSLNYQHKLITNIGLSNLGVLSAGGKTAACFMTFIQTVAGVMQQNTCPPTLLKTLSLIRFTPVPIEYQTLSESLNLAMHDRI